MKKVLIIGASGSLAKFVIEALLENCNVQLTLFLRNKNKLQIKNASDCQIIEADVMNSKALNFAVQGQDIIYVNLSGDLGKMANNIIHAMNENQIKRIIAISSIGIYNFPLKSVLIPYRQLADIIEASGLTYTILRPDWFTNENEIDFIITQKGEPEIGKAISRKSIAHFIAQIIDNPSLYENQNLGISKPS